MEFGLSEEQTLLQDSINRFLDEQVPLQRVRRFAESPDCTDIWQGLTELGIPALLIPDYIETSDMIWGSTMQPVGALFAVIALVWCGIRGQALTEMRRESRLPVPNWLFYWIKFGIPIGIVSTLVYSWAG